jgi:hypothetical protein
MGFQLRPDGTGVCYHYMDMTNISAVCYKFYLGMYAVVHQPDFGI